MKANGVSTPDLFGFAPIIAERIELSSGKSEATHQGRYAEFMVCAYLAKAGFVVHHIDTAGYDLIVECAGNAYRVDVKSTCQTYIGPFKEMARFHAIKSHWLEGAVSKTRRPVTREDCDLLALFYVPLESVAFVRPNGKPHYRVPLSQFREDREGTRSFKSAIEGAIR